MAQIRLVLVFASLLFLQLCSGAPYGDFYGSNLECDEFDGLSNFGANRQFGAGQNGVVYGVGDLAGFGGNGCNQLGGCSGQGIYGFDDVYSNQFGERGYDSILFDPPCGDLAGFGGNGCNQLGGCSGQGIYGFDDVYSNQFGERGYDSILFDPPCGDLAFFDVNGCNQLGGCSGQEIGCGCCDGFNNQIEGCGSYGWDDDYCNMNGEYCDPSIIGDPSCGDCSGFGCNGFNQLGDYYGEDCCQNTVSCGEEIYQSCGQQSQCCETNEAFSSECFESSCEYSDSSANCNSDIGFLENNDCVGNVGIYC